MALEDLRNDLNEPSKDNYYAMRCAQAWGGGELEDYIVPFVFHEEADEDHLPTDEEIAADKAKWRRELRLRGVKLVQTPEEPSE